MPPWHGQVAAALHFPLVGEGKYAVQPFGLHIVQLPQAVLARAITQHRARSLFDKTCQHRIITLGDQCAKLRNAGEKFAEGRLDCVQISKDIRMIKLHRGADGVLRLVMVEFGDLVEKGGVVFIAFNHKIRTVADIVVAAKGLDYAANHEARRFPHAVQGGG